MFLRRLSLFHHFPHSQVSNSGLTQVNCLIYSILIVSPQLILNSARQVSHRLIHGMMRLFQQALVQLDLQLLYGMILDFMDIIYISRQI